MVGTSGFTASVNYPRVTFAASIGWAYNMRTLAQLYGRAGWGKGYRSHGYAFYCLGDTRHWKDGATAEFVTTTKCWRYVLWKLIKKWQIK